MVRNQGSSSSIRATACVASAPDERSSRRRVATLGGRWLTRLLTPASVSRASRRRGEWSGERSPGRRRGRSPGRGRRAAPAAVVVGRLRGGAGAARRRGADGLRAAAATWTPTVSEALYAGDDRAAALDVLLEVLTAPGLSLVRSWSSCRCWSGWCAGGPGGRRLWVVIAAVLVRPADALLKEYFGRVRPPFEDGGARLRLAELPERPLLGHRHAGHRRPGARLAAARRPGAPAVALAAGVLLVLLVGLTRMWLGVHYLSDVVGGWALGRRLDAAHRAAASARCPPRAGGAAG